MLNARFLSVSFCFVSLCIFISIFVFSREQNSKSKLTTTKRFIYECLGKAWLHAHVLRAYRSRVHGYSRIIIKLQRETKIILCDVRQKREWGRRNLVRRKAANSQLIYAAHKDNVIVARVEWANGWDFSPHFIKIAANVPMVVNKRGGYAVTEMRVCTFRGHSFLFRFLFYSLFLR